jgi:hypothetical protein
MTEKGASRENTIGMELIAKGWEKLGNSRKETPIYYV